MTAQTVATLKTYFQTGDKPTQSQFSNVMDSFVSFLDTSAQSIASDFNIGGFVAVSGNATILGSTVVGAPSGGSQGVGTLNSTGLFVNGVPVIVSGGNGTVVAGTANQIAYYPASTNSVSGTNALPNGTTATTQTAGDTSTKVATMQTFSQGANGASHILIQTQTASNSPTISFLNIPTGFDHYELRITGILPATNTATLLCAVSINNGVSYIGGSNYFWAHWIQQNNGTNLGQDAQSTSSWTFSGGISNAAFGIYGNIMLMLNQTNGASYVSMLGFSNSSDLGRASTLNGSGEVSATNINAIQLSMSSGNITSGKLSLYGVRNT